MDRISEFAADFLLNAAWQIAIITLVAGICSRLMRNVAARYRHALWVASLMLSLALPLWGVLHLTIVAQRQPAARSADSVPARGNLATIPGSAPALESAVAEESSPTLGRLLQRRSRPVETTPSLSLALALVFALFILYRLRALWLSWQRTRSLRQSADERVIPARMGAVARRCCAALRLRSVPIRCSTRATVPVTLGARRPLIILPESFYLDPPDETLVSVLGHEMAHVARRDYAFNLVCESVVENEEEVSNYQLPPTMYHQRVS